MFTPSTVLRLLENVDIDNDYANTFTFSDLATQTAFFIGKSKHTFTDFTIIRKEKLSVRIPANVEAMWDVSYMMFQNANFGNKWFYAFITDMKYVNDAVTEITFEIDVLQTWLFDVEIKDCYVEREHVANDTIGTHLVEENLNVGDYVVAGTEMVDEITPLSMVVATTCNDTGDDIHGGMFTGVYSGNGFFCSNNRSSINDYIDAISELGKGDAISSIFMCPTALLPIDIDFFLVADAQAQHISKSVSKNLSSLDGYTPRNNKLLTYPYNFLVVSNTHGQSNIYKYEMFSTSNTQWDISGDIGTSPTVFLVPKNYKGLLKNYEEIITLSGYPICNWATDIYKIWQAQNAVSNGVAIGGSALGLIASVVTLNPVGIAGSVLGVAQSIGTFYEKSILPNPIHGTMTGAGNVSQGIQNFIFSKKTVRAEFAKIIDNFFDRFGYKVNELKTPNFKSRTNWNFLKTMECNISGNIPNSDLKRIHSIFNNGVTFWHNDNVGNYNRSNTPI